MCDFEQKTFDFEFFPLWLFVTNFGQKSVFSQINSLKKSFRILFQLLGISYNHENWQVNAEKYFKKLIGGILIF